MAEDGKTTEEVLERGSKKGLLVGVVLAILGAAGGFVATSGMLSSDEKGEKKQVSGTEESIAFLPLDPMTVQIGDPTAERYLRFTAQLEVKSGSAGEVEKMTPRIVDVLNTYLRSVTLADVEHPAALLELRSQMRRRIDLVVGSGKVNDLLVMEFVVN